LDKAQWKTMLWSLVLSLIIEYGVCLVIASFFFNDQNHYMNAFWLMLGLWALQIALWFKNLIVSTIQYYLHTKSNAVADIAGQFLKADLPYEGADGMDIDDYLEAVTEGEQSTRKQIIAAAQWMGMLSAMGSRGSVKGRRMISMSNIALQQYLRKRQELEGIRSRRASSFAETQAGRSRY
jgi:hypothetical protein